MRVYIIGNDGITLCRKAPATVNDGEIAVASNKELHAAPLSGKRLLALWNALPGVPKRRKVGDRDALIDQLWSAIEMLPDPEPQRDPKRPSKQDVVIAMLRQPASDTPASRPPFSVQTSAGRTDCDTRIWPSLMARLPDWSIGRHRSYGVPGGNCITLDRLWASVVI